MDRLPTQIWMTDAAAARVLDALEAEGGPDCARFVGGCVRNAILNREVDDIDIATRLEPEQAMAALKRAGLEVAPTGLEHGTVTAIADRRPFEITSLRRDVQTDGRRAVVAFTTDWAEDAQRRDFRLNALFANRDGRLYDYVGGGVEDALAGRIVFVGDAETRVREDYLRILRFFRFFAWYGRGLPDPVGLAACAALAPGLARLSAERVSKELLKLCAAPDPRVAVAAMRETGVLQAVLPGPLRIDRFGAMVDISPDPLLRLSALLPDDPVRVGAIGQALRLSNDQRERLIEALPSAPGVGLDMDARAARAAIYRLGAEVFADRLRRALAEAPDRAEAAAPLLKLARDWTPPRLPITGGEIMAAGVERGPEVGRLLNALEAWWVDQDFPDAGLSDQLRRLMRAS